jgi:L-aminopeptidase/D-esterase-like protein
LIRPGPRNTLTDVAGLAVGSADDAHARTGVTVILPERPALACVDVRGGSPGTVNASALGPATVNRDVDGIVLSGGSAFGLVSVTGAAGWLAARGLGRKQGDWPVPLVAGANIGDLGNGGDKRWDCAASPYHDLAKQAADAASPEVRQGNVGVGMGAVSGPFKGGQGSASAFDPETGVTLGALVCVNSAGSVAMPNSPTMWAWHLEQDGELGGQPAPTAATGHVFETKHGLNQATTIGVIATDARLPHEHLLRLAQMGQDGYAFALRPIHTPLDGDVLFGLSTALVEAPDDPHTLARLGAIAADVVARAVMRAVYEASDLGEHRSYRSAWGHRLRSAGSATR